MIKTHYRNCNLCEAVCGLVITTEGAKITEIRGDENDPLSRGHICPKALALIDLHEDPDRLKSPVKRTTSGWEKISWQEAIDQVAKQFSSIQKEFGQNSVGIYMGNPNVHNLGSMTMLSFLVKQLKTKNRFTAASVDQLPHQFAAFFLYGNQTLIPIPDIDRTQYMLIIGGNPVVSNGSIMTAPDIKNRLKAIINRGGKVVVIDPRKTETAEIATSHHFIKLGTDVYFLLSVIHELITSQLVSPRKLLPFLDGLDQLLSIVEPFPPEITEPLTGIGASVVKTIAREFARADAAVCYGRMGASVQEFGGMVHWLINVLNIITGNLDRPGGSMFTSPAFDFINLPGRKGHYDIWRSRVKKLPEFGGELPAVTMADEMLTPGDGQIKAMLTVAGNPVLSVPNGGRLEKAFANLQFMAAIDFYINETTRHANIILPPVHYLFTHHYDIIFHALAVRNTTKFSPPVFEKNPHEKTDGEIYLSLAKALANKQKDLKGKIKFQLLKFVTPEKIVKTGLKRGPYKLSLKKLLAHPGGLDLGPLKPVLPQRLSTKNKKILLVPEVFARDMERVKKQLNTAHSNNSLTLIGRRHLRSNNSWMHNCPSLMTGKNRFDMLIHPLDAERRHINQGQLVLIKSNHQQFEVHAQVTDSIMPGVISVPHGWGHHADGMQMNVAKVHPGGNINALNSGECFDELTGNADTHVRNIEVTSL